MRQLLVLITAGTAATAAHAQLPDRETRTGSRIPVEVEKHTKEVTETRQIQWRFGYCVIDRHRETAARYLLDYPAPGGNDPERRDMIRKIADPDCLLKARSTGFGDVQMALPADTMRYALADALVRRELAVASLTDLDRIPRLQHPVFNEADCQLKPGQRASKRRLQELAERRSASLGRIYMSEFGECAVRSNPAIARELLLTDPTSAEEDAVFRRLAPALGQCLEAGRSLKLNKMTIRGTIAFNYYRLAKSPRSTGVSK